MSPGPEGGHRHDGDIVDGHDADHHRHWPEVTPRELDGTLGGREGPCSIRG
jgi:hypothetical protein